MKGVLVFLLIGCNTPESAMAHTRQIVLQFQQTSQGWAGNTVTAHYESDIGVNGGQASFGISRMRMSHASLMNFRPLGTQNLDRRPARVRPHSPRSKCGLV